MITRRADVEMMNIIMLVSVEGVGGWGGDDHYLCIPGLDLSLFFQAVQPSYPAQFCPTANMVTLTTTVTTTHGLTQHSNSGVKARVTTDSIIHLARVCLSTLSFESFALRVNTKFKLYVYLNSDPVLNAFCIFGATVYLTISHCSELNVLRLPAFRNVRKCIIGK